MNTTDTWLGCYRRGWGKELVPESYSHPAKVSYRLAARIYAHIVAEGWVPLGSTVIDPFAGIGGFAYHALFAGLSFVGVELEEKFVALGNANIAFWNARYGDGRFAKWGTARIVRGDSRHLLDVVRGAGCCVSSPPFGEGETRNRFDFQDGYVADMMSRAYTQDRQGNTLGNLGNLRADERGFAAAISSPPYADTINANGDGPGMAGNAKQRSRIAAGSNTGWAAQSRKVGYGSAPGQLGAMPEGSFDAAIASPPYVSGGHHPDQTGAWGGQAQSVPREVAGYGQSDGQLGQMPEGSFSAAISSLPYADRVANDSQRTMAHEGGWRARGLRQMNEGETYGTTPGQLGAMPEGNFAQAVVSSPPYERSLDTHEQLDKRLERTGGFVQGMKETRYGSNPFTFLSINPSGLNNQERHEIASQNPQIGSLEGDSFWSAARLILAQTYAALRPGGHAVWVVKSFVRGGAIVDFPGQWRALCESVGFTTLHEHHASLIEDNGAQLATDGNHRRKRTERKSFFRRLAENKGSPRIDFEVVLCMSRP